MRYAEKRDFLRMPIDCELKFSKRGSDQQLEGHVINLSGQGILFTTTAEIEEAAVLEIVLTPSNSLPPPMQASVVVIRSIYNDVVYEVACEIENIA